MNTGHVDSQSVEVAATKSGDHLETMTASLISVAEADRSESRIESEEPAADTTADVSADAEVAAQPAPSMWYRLPIHDEALVSEFAGDEDMDEIIEMFVNGLADRMSRVMDSFESRDYSALSSIAHQLKGASGGYGFGALTEAALAVETPARNSRPADELQAPVEHLVRLMRRAIAGYPAALQDFNATAATLASEEKHQLPVPVSLKPGNSEASPPPEEPLAGMDVDSLLAQADKLADQDGDWKMVISLLQELTRVVHSRQAQPTSPAEPTPASS